MSFLPRGGSSRFRFWRRECFDITPRVVGVRTTVSPGPLLCLASGRGSLTLRRGRNPQSPLMSPSALTVPWGRHCSSEGGVHSHLRSTPSTRNWGLDRHHTIKEKGTISPQFQSIFSSKFILTLCLYRFKVIF